MKTSPLRMTHQREVILEELRGADDHPTADELYERVRKRLPRISLATVYRNLEVLAEAGLIRRLEVSGRQKRFDWNTSDHDHVYCVQCHRVDNVMLAKRISWRLAKEQAGGYRVDGYRVEFYGLCPQCRAEREAQPKEKGEATMAGCKRCATGLSDKQREVLEALAQCKEACGSKDIAAATSLEPKQVSCQITALKKKGYVASPARCKYEITDEGRKALA